MPLQWTRPKKQHVPATSQIGVIQTAILEWLLTREEELEAFGSKDEKLVLAARGVPWSVKRFSKTCERACKPDGSPDASKISTSLKQLETKKGLVKRHGHRTSYVKLTEQGRVKAIAKRDDPRTWREKRATERARRRAHAIAYELYRYEDQMSEINWYVSCARQVYYLNELQTQGQIQPSEKRDLDNVLGKLRDANFNLLLPTILQNSELPPEYIREVRDICVKITE